MAMELADYGINVNAVCVGIYGDSAAENSYREKAKRMESRWMW